MANCDRCGGACCESFTTPTPFVSDDFQELLLVRSTPASPGHRTFESPCPHLNRGRCQIYDVRPKLCRVFEPGGIHCITTVRARRTTEEAVAILGHAYAVGDLFQKE